MLLSALVLAAAALALEQSTQAGVAGGAARLKVFLDCTTFDCYTDYLREEVDIVEYVRDRSDADVHVLLTGAETGARGREYTFAFLGQGRFDGRKRTLTVTSSASDSEDRVRRALASALTIGLLEFLSGDALPAGLQVSAAIDSEQTAPAPVTDRWNRWIFSLNGNVQFEAEESQRERDWGLSVSADRITPEWKMTFGGNFNQSREEFDLDEEEDSLTVERRNRSFDWLVVRALGEHWSAGATGELRSSTFDNTELDVLLAPALEWNFFPYSMYTRRQLRALYGLGVARKQYYEETLFFKTEETRARQDLSITYEQREPWGTLEGSAEWRNYFPGFDTHRISVDGEANLRMLRGLSLNVEASVSRIRDQLSLPRRAATPEEVLLELRELRSGFEARLEVGIQYQFGSAFAAIVNPRFGQ
jgi:hypothetical protein